MASSREPVRILHLDDSPLDAELVQLTLEIAQDQMPSAVTYVQTRRQFLEALQPQQHQEGGGLPPLQRPGFDLILSDYRMPGYNGDEALADARRLCPEIPFIMVTGEMGEDRAIETLKRGAADYVLKGNMIRLIPAIERALLEAENHRKRREAEAALRESQRTLALAIEATKLGLFDYHVQSGRLLWSELAKEHFGLPPEAEVTYEVFLEGLHPDDRERVHETVQRALTRESGGAYHDQYRTLGLQERKERWLDARGQVFFDEHGQAVRFIGATTEISALKYAEEELRNAHRETAEILESVQDPFYGLDSEWRFTYVNARAEAALGKTREELLGRILWEVFPAVLGTESERMVRKAARERTPLHYEGRSAVTGAWLDIHLFPKADGGLSVLYRDVSERKAQEQALRLSEERFSAAFHLSPHPQVISRVNDGVFLEVNQALLDLYGMTKEEVIGHSSFEIGILADPSEREQLVELLRRDGSVQGFPMRIKTRTQGERAALLSVSLLKESEGRTMLTIISDVTAARQAHEELEKANERLEIILRGATDALILYDRQFRFAFIGESSARDFREQGRDPEALIGKVLWEEFPEFVGSAALAKMQEAMTQRHLVTFEGSYRDKWYDTRCIPISDGGLAVLSVNVSERKQNQEAVEEAALFPEENPSPVLRIDQEGILLYANRASAGLLALHRSRVGIAAPAPLASAVQDAYARQASEIFDLSAEETIYAFLVVPVRERGYANLYGRDVTEQRKAETALRRLSAELEERVQERTRRLEAANRELESFSYTVSHDLKAPLRIIHGYAQLLAQKGKGNLTPMQHEALGVIQQSAQSMEELIRALLEFSRLSRKEPRVSIVDTRRMVEEVVQEQRRALGGEAGERVMVELGELPRVMADPLLLRQVFANLLSNAFKFTRTTAAPEVRVMAEPQDMWVTFCVSDNGVGFPKGQAEKLFQVFQRLHSLAEFEGTGIGLANVRKIIERHGGQVCAEGEEGKGASLYFTLPVQT